MTEAVARARNLRFLAIALLIAVTVPRLVQRGMFSDGMFYASVARNLGTGQGTFWSPSYSRTIYQEYHEQPPLGIGIQAAAFAIAGDHPAVERVYSLIMLGMVAGLIMAVWRLLLPARYDWLPIVFWVIPSIVTWAAINNMIENTQAVFTTASVYCVLNAIRPGPAAAAARWSALGGALVIAAMLIKGPVGAFPIVVPFLCLWLPAPTRRSPLPVFVVMIATMAVAVLLLALLPGFRYAFGEYLRTQLAPVFAHRPPVWVQVGAVGRHLAGGIIGRLAVVTGIVWLCRRRDSTGDVHWRTAAFLLSIAVSASFPLAISPKIAGHYMVPSVPFYAMAAAAVALPAVRSLRRLASGPWGRRMPVSIGVVLLGLTVAIPLVHGTLEPRDLGMIATMDAVGESVSRGSVIGTCGAAREQWGLLSYMQRLLRVSLDPSDRPVGGWFFQPSNIECAPPPACRRVTGGTAGTLYRCDAAAEGTTRSRRARPWLTCSWRSALRWRCS